MALRWLPPGAPIEDSFAFQHLVEALKSEPSWTPEMVCAYNDYSPETTDRLIEAYDRYKAKHAKKRKRKAKR